MGCRPSNLVNQLSGATAARRPWGSAREGISNRVSAAHATAHPPSIRRWCLAETHGQEADSLLQGTLSEVVTAARWIDNLRKSGVNSELISGGATSAVFPLRGQRKENRARLLSKEIHYL